MRDNVDYDAGRCNRCGVRGEHYDWCEALGFDAQDQRLCPGDGCPGCYHCTSTTGDSDADQSAESRWNMEPRRAASVARLEGEDGAVVPPSRDEAGRESDGLVGRARSGLTRDLPPGE